MPVQGDTYLTVRPIRAALFAREDRRRRRAGLRRTIVERQPVTHLSRPWKQVTPRVHASSARVNSCPPVASSGTSLGRRCETSSDLLPPRPFRDLSQAPFGCPPTATAAKFLEAPREATVDTLVQVFELPLGAWGMLHGLDKRRGMWAL